LKEIDLGSSEKINVKLDGQIYSLRKPTVSDVRSFKAKSDDKGHESEDIDLFLDFVSALGLPLQIAENLELSMLEKLTDGLLGSSKKK